MKEQKQGTYNHCSKCKARTCCCDFDNDIDNVVTTLEEKQLIIERVGMENEKYFKKINDKAYNILSVNKICPFFKEGCTIYDVRPSDCRLFPYDIKKIEDKYFLIKYDMSCGSKKVNENVDEIINKLIPIIETYTDDLIAEKVNKLKFKILKEIILSGRKNESCDF